MRRLQRADAAGLAGGQLRGMRRGAGARRGPCRAGASCREARGRAKRAPRGGALGLLRCLLAAALSGMLLASILGASASASIYGAGARASIAPHPASTAVGEGQSASFEAAADAFPAATVQWQKSTNGGTTWSNIAGATAAKFTIASTKTSENGNEFRATFKNVAGTATSEPATLTVHKAPAITKQPANTTVNEGENAIFESTASGFPAPTVQWELSTDSGGTWNPIAGANSTQLAVANANFSENGYQYRARFTNAAGE